MPDALQTIALVLAVEWAARGLWHAMGLLHAVLLEPRKTSAQVAHPPMVHACPSCRQKIALLPGIVGVRHELPTCGWFDREDIRAEDVVHAVMGGPPPDVVN